MISVRGAVTIDKDTREEVLNSTGELLESMITDNNLSISQIISIIFTCTGDIKSAYPAEAARGIGIVNAGLICLNEMYVEGSLDKCIRVLIYADSIADQAQVRHIYIGKARQLRPDLYPEYK